VTTFRADVVRAGVLTFAAAADDTAGPIVVTAEALPWETIVDLNLWGDTVEFGRGSVAAPTPGRVPFLLDHDTHPFGYGVTFVDTPAALVATMAVPRDELDDPRTAAAVRQMRNGVRTAVSVGVAIDEVTAVDKGDHTHYVVNAARLLELSSVVVPRFDDARVQSIAAQGRPTAMPLDQLNASTTQPDPDDPDTPDPDNPDTPDDPSTSSHPAQGRGTLTVAGRGLAPARRQTSGGGVSLSLLALGRSIAQAGRQGNVQEANRVLRELTAAWTDVTTADVEGLVRPQWLTEVVGLIEFGAPAIAAWRQGTITSNPIMYPYWQTLPVVGEQTAQKLEIPSGPAQIGNKSVDVSTYAGGNDVARQVIDWSTPDYVSEYFRAATEVYARTIDAVFVADLIASAGMTIAFPVGGTLVEVIGAAIGVGASSGLGGAINILCSGDVLGGLWSTLAVLNGSLFGAVNAPFPTPRVIVDPLAPPSTIVVGSSNAAISFQSAGAPVRLQALDLPRGGIDLAVWGYFAETVLYPEALCTVTGYVPPVVPTPVPPVAAEPSTSSRRSSSSSS
jgi:phage head maturation protease